MENVKWVIQANGRYIAVLKFSSVHWRTIQNTVIHTERKRISCVYAGMVLQVLNYTSQYETGSSSYQMADVGHAASAAVMFSG